MGNSRTRSFWIVVLCAVFALAGALSLGSGFGAKAEEPAELTDVHFTKPQDGAGGIPTIRPDVGDYTFVWETDSPGFSAGYVLAPNGNLANIEINGTPMSELEPGEGVQFVSIYMIFFVPARFVEEGLSVRILPEFTIDNQIFREGVWLDFKDGAWVEHQSEPALTPITVIEMQKPSYRSDADDYTFAFGFSGQFDTAPNTYLSAERFPEGIEVNGIPFKTLLGKNLQGNYNSTAGVTFSSNYMMFYVPKDAFDPAEENSLKIASGTSFFGTIIEQEVFVDYDPLTEKWYTHGEIPPPPPSVTADSLPGAVSFRPADAGNDYTFELAFTGNEFTIPTASGGYLMAWELPSSMSVNGKGINTLIGTDRDPVNGTYPTTAI